MDTDNSQIYKVAKYLDKYTKDGAYLQKLNKYLHKVQYGGDAMDIAREIQRMVGQVISIHDDERKALMAKLQKLSGSKDITLGDYDKTVTKINSVLGQHTPINEKPLINVEQTPEPNPDKLETSHFDIVGYIVDPKTNRVEGTIDDAKYMFSTIDVAGKNYLHHDHISTLLEPLTLKDKVKIMLFRVKDNKVRIVLNKRVKIREFVDPINKEKAIVVELPNINNLQSQSENVSVRLFVKPMTQKLSTIEQPNLQKKAINKLAKEIFEEIKQTVAKQNE
jgi:hypothetical protein